MNPRRCSVRVRVWRAARHSPHLTVGQVAALVGCHPSTARKHLNNRATAPPAVTLRQRTVAQRLAVSRSLLVRLPRGGDPDARKTAAADIATQPAALARLAADHDGNVRYVAAGNAATPPAALARLAAGHDENVRYVAAGNAATPPAALLHATSLRRGRAGG